MLDKAVEHIREEVKKQQGAQAPMTQGRSREPSGTDSALVPLASRDVLTTESHHAAVRQERSPAVRQR